MLEKYFSMIYNGSYIHHAIIINQLKIKIKENFYHYNTLPAVKLGALNQNLI